MLLVISNEFLKRRSKKKKLWYNIRVSKITAVIPFGRFRISGYRNLPQILY
tara:strand:+ start:133 stop:285 length:153 start_codon:yes stop_codon:yes gene_type:complete